MPRPFWMVPCEYNDDRFSDNEQDTPVDSTQEDVDASIGVRSLSETEELFCRPARADEAGQLKVNTTDCNPVNYGRGPHQDEIDVSDDDDLEAAFDDDECEDVADDYDEYSEGF